VRSTSECGAELCLKGIRMKDDTNPTRNARPVYDSVAEFADETGMSLALAYQGFKDGTIPCIRMGGKGSRILIPRAAIAKWLESAGRN
jgi:Helix-turn-helix domain